MTFILLGKPLDIKVIMRLYSIVCLGLFLLFAFFFQHHLFIKASARVKNHARVIASSLWTFEKLSPTAYLQLATEADNYEEVVVFDGHDKIFLKINGPPLPRLEALLRSIRLIPVYRLEEKIEYEGHSIGKIRVNWPCRAMYVYLNVLLSLILFLIAFGLFLKLLEAKHNLEIRVRERTAELENEVKVRQAAEESLRRQAERLALHVLHTPLGVIEWDPDFKVVEWNMAAEEIFEYSRAEALGRTAYELIIPDESLETVQTVWRELTAHSGGTRSINTNRTKSGKIKTCEWYNTTLTTETGKVFGVASLILDSTKRIKAEEENQRLQGQLLQAQKMEAIGNLAGGVAHDFNNMLGVILGHTELAMAVTESSHPLHGNLREIRRAAQRSADITRQLLAFARKQTVTPKIINLNDIVDGMLKMLRRLIGEGIDLAWLPETGLWPVKVDPSQIDQILVNLCVNSRDAIKSGVGKITVETGNANFDEEYCRNHPGFVPGSFVAISVSDNGCGMDKETLNHIFEPFFTTKEIGEGTGLGMATVYGAVKQNNGFVNVYSEPDQGTTVSIYLPRHMGTVEKTTPEEETKLTPGGSETIILVEDETAILEMTTIMLQQMGYTVLPAKTPSEALSLLEEHGRAVHLVITDVVMPEMNGWNLAKILAYRQPGLKFLFTSGYTGNVIANHGVLNEGIHFIQKPFSMKDLGDKVRQVLDVNKLANPHPTTTTSVPT